MPSTATAATWRKNGGWTGKELPLSALHNGQRLLATIRTSLRQLGRQLEMSPMSPATHPCRHQCRPMQKQRQIQKQRQTQRQRQKKTKTQIRKTCHTQMAQAPPPQFETLKAIYPDRVGDQKWQTALTHVKARLKEGAIWQELLDGAQRYADYCAAEQLTGPNT